MKKIGIFACCMLLILLGACTRRDTDFLKPANFYYINTEITYNSKSGVITAEQREAVHFNGELSEFIRAYLSGPQSSDLQLYVPEQTELISCNMEQDTVYLVFSEEFAELTGVRLSASCSALLMSINEFSGAEAVRIQAENEKLADKEEIYLTMDDIVLLDPVISETN